MPGYYCAMDIKELIISQSVKNSNELFHAARKVPADKLTWRPLDAGRHVLDLCQECALSPLWSVEMLHSRRCPDFTPEMMAEFEAMKEKLTDLDACEAACKKNLETLAEAVRAFPDADWGSTLTLPWGVEKEYSFAAIGMIHYWNAVYHTGQVNYIQTLYGDHSM
ncbi:MAG: hypothetical protein JNM85_10550 [Chthonomonas sp.]|nr:hypothetical protein [Chthonomonas sp.]